MKNKIANLLFLFLCVAFFSLFSCSDKKDGDVIPGSATLLDKWWYSGSANADIYIFSNGNFEQSDGNSSANNFLGYWVWTDEANLVLKVDYLPGQGPGQPTIAWLRFSNLTANSVLLEQSLTGEEGSYQGPFEYSTVQ